MYQIRDRIVELEKLALSNNSELDTTNKKLVELSIDKPSEAVEYKLLNVIYERYEDLYDMKAILKALDEVRKLMIMEIDDYVNNR